MNKLGLSLCFILLGHGISAQQKKETYNSLLWRITGNGLTKPSYVYGTIHITDKRVFHFTDSLYKSLEECQGFAAELDINKFSSEYFESFKGDEEKQKNSKKLLIDSLDKKILAKYKIELEKKFKKSIDQITVTEVKDAAEDWLKEMLRNGEMDTFMDAWLFDLARRQGKWVGGIEDYEDQDGLEDSISLEEKIETISKADEVNSMLEWMINVYIKQALDSIDRSDHVWQGSRDALLVKRNIKMVRRMDSLAHIRSMLFAVGAAHLPSDEGVINLLRQKGFTVTPVYSKNRIAPENYKYKKVELPWHDVESPDSSYKLKMPGKPVKYPIAGEDSPEMQLYLDLGTFRAYLALAIPIADRGQSGGDSMLLDLIKYYKETMMNVSEKDIIVNNKAGKEISGTDKDDGEIRLQFFMGSSSLVMSGIAGYKKNVLFGEDPEKFFSSLKIVNEARVLPAKENKKWQRYNFGKFGFSVELPAEFQEEKGAQENITWDQTVFKTLDPSGTTFIGIVVSTIKRGYYSNIDSAYFEETLGTMLANMNGEMISKKHFFRDGYPAFLATAKTTNDNESINIKMLFINKGPRRYLLFATSEGDNQDKRFFDSFTFLRENTTWGRTMPADKSFSIWAPSGLTEDDMVKEKDRITYTIQDTNSNVQVFIDKEIFPSYFWAESDSILLSDKIRTYIGNNDSVIFNKSFTTGKIRGVDLLVQMNGTHNLKRLRGLLNGDTVYTIYTFLPAQYLEMDSYRKVFEEFRITYETVSTSLYKRKPEELLVALQTKDSADFEKATEVFKYVWFLKEDVPLLQKALIYPYHDFDSTYYNNTNKSISGLIETLDTNYSSISFVKENYQKLTGDRELMKPFLLGLLSFIKTAESYALLKELVTKFPPKISKEYYWRSGLYDSLGLTKALFPEILSLAGDPGMYDFINDLTLRMLDSNYIDVIAIKKYKNEFIKTGKRVLALSAEEKEQNYFYYSSLSKLLGKINDLQGNEILKKLGAINSNSLKLDVVLAQAQNNQTPDVKNIRILGASNEFRQDLYKGLKEIKKLNLFPQEFLNQRSLAQGSVFNYANEDDYPPDQIQFVGERLEIYMGKKQKFYLFKVCFKNDEDGDECYFGVAGPYSLDQKNLASSNEVTDIYWDETFDNKKIDGWLKDIIKRTEQWIKERDAEKE